MKSKSLTPERLERIKQIITEQEELATYHGITQATCLNCGKVTKDISKLEMMNDLDPTCATCETHLVAWFCNDGRLVVTGETEDGEEIREELIKENKQMNTTKWANLPTTCADFVAHPHIVEGRGCYTCQIALASEQQGTTALMSALLDLGISCDIHQTGGFTMCVYIKTNANATSYIYANAEGFSHYLYDSDDGENWYFGDDFDEQSAAQKAQKIADTMKEKNLQAVEL